jgi:hypothetical protein
MVDMQGLQEDGDDAAEAISELQSSAEAQISEQAKKIDFFITEYSVELLANKMRDGDFVVPSYQREYTWEYLRKTRFIESLLMGLPIPFLFFWEDDSTGLLEIVDGSQRLRTIQEFVHGDLKLGGLEQLSLLDGFRFRDLTEARQRKVKNRSIRGIVLNRQADDQARFDLFDRINTGSKVANTAEVRRGALAGPFMNLVIELAESETFAKLAPLPEKQAKERYREELVTRFFAYGDGLDEYRDRVSEFLYAYTKRMNTAVAAGDVSLDDYRETFRTTMAFVKRTFPYGFRRSEAGITTPRARFEAIAVGARLALRDDNTLLERSVDVESWLSGDEFRKITGSDGANAVSKLKSRIEYVRKRLVEA